MHKCAVSNDFCDAFLKQADEQAFTTSLERIWLNDTG